ncbi:hypothetical protein ABG768_020642 [Culter alburnus]|uniref:Uncharacterized protein n=1 Tax=Culter alburnus TaxID=194366 RepID=A0AAW2AYT1_CULAL
MAHPHTSLVLLILVCSLWLSDGKTYFTHLGTKCIEDCKLDDGVYKCKTIDKDGKYLTMDCSPQENMDSQDIQYTASWGYCGLVMDEMDHYGSYYGVLCDDKCAKGNDGYYWCHTAQGWDYCSPSENTDYMNRPCKEESPCGKQGYRFNWCWVKGGSWGYCGQVMTKENHYGSSYGVLCYDKCDKGNDGYYWCHTAQGWDYCSPSENTDYMNRQCNENSPCGKQGYRYNWCWTSDQSTYDYHGHIEEEEDNCTYSNLRDTATQYREGTDTQKEGQVICTCYDKGNKKKNTFTAVPAPDDITDGSQWRNEVEILIRRWDNRYLVDQQRSNLLKYADLRIDMQGFVQQRYYNLQIQVNVSPGESTSVSQIFVTDGIPDRYIQRAFLESFRRRARVFVEVEANQNQSLVLEMFDP